MLVIDPVGYSAAFRAANHMADLGVDFSARVIPSAAYTGPEVAWVGLPEDPAQAQGVKVKKGFFTYPHPTLG